MKALSTTMLGAAALGAAMISAAPLRAEATSDAAFDSTADAQLPREAGGQSAQLLSAFVGLDDGLLRGANRICGGARGQDGMPVIFSTEIDHSTMQAGDFRVTTWSGRTVRPHCVSLLPATDAGELRTVLMVGDFGAEDGDPPGRVEIVGHLRSIDGALDFKGAAIGVTPLARGPSLVLAEIADLGAADPGLGLRRTKGSPCPSDGVAQAVRAVWAGGVTLPGGAEPGSATGAPYQVTVRAADGAERVVTPVALADLGDGDNNHLLCLDTADRAVSVAVPAGVLTDPGEDLNPATSARVLP